MLTSFQIRELFQALNQELKAKDIHGEVGLCGGAVMCLVFNARAATKDVDAIFIPTKEIREAAEKIATRFGVPFDWLNDAAKGFFPSDPPKRDVLQYSHLDIWAPTPEYMLAMKCISARFDSHDKDDVVFLIRHLKLHSVEKVFSIISDYYPRSQVPPKTQFLIEEILSEDQ